jgi:hypothetical protein
MAHKNVTAKTRFENPDDELLPLTRCVCGVEHQGWNVNHHGLRRVWVLWQTYREARQHANAEGHIVRYQLWTDCYGKYKTN